MFTNNVLDFYNFAANRITLRLNDYIWDNPQENYYYDNAHDYSKVYSYVKNHCKDFINTIELDLVDISSDQSIDEKYKIYNDLYYYIFDEDTFASDFANF